MNSCRQLFLGLGALLLSLGMLSTDVMAQNKRASESLFLNARVGLSTYGGDRDSNPGEDFTSLSVGDGLSAASYSLGLEFGYQFSPAFSLSIGYQFANYTEILDPIPFAPVESAPLLDEDESSKIRSTIPVLLRWMILPQSRLSPYAHVGGNLSFGSYAAVGEEASTETAFGPSVGLGLDYVVSNRASIFLEVTGHYTFGDEAIDGADPEVDGDETDFDLLGFYGLGLRYSFKPACDPPVITSLEGPERVAINEPATYMVTLNENACQPVDLTWDLGDGTTATGMTVTHTYTEPGDYVVTANAVNSVGEDSRSMNVEVFDPCPVTAEIVSLAADPADMIINENVTFTAEVLGTEPVEYSWTFGDGGTSTQAAPVHVFDEPGEYTVNLTITNCGGEASRDLNIVVREFRCEDITELNSVFFDRNSSELDEEAMSLLDENISIMQECPDILARLDGYADRTERRPRRLSTQRAETVEQYYIDNGIAPTRLMARGLGRDPLAGKGVDGRRNRRVDSIIVDTFEMEENSDM
ncbi:MAG: PKD domain-containing protein [Bacteroidota bacterium]